MRQEIRELALVLLLGLPLSVAAAGVGGYVLARGALAPLARMTDRARAITAERLHDRLPIANPDDELGRLATVFNDTLGRLESSFQQMRRFTSNVSHELRTPLTAIRSVGEVGLREQRDADAYRAVIGSMLEDTDRLTCLVDRLLTVSRAESGDVPLVLDTIDLCDLADNVTAHLGVLAEEKQQSLTLERAGHPTCRGDQIVLRQAVINLIDNAIKYTPVGGEIRIRVLESAGAAVLEVIDTGPGIRAGRETRMFDRFDRGGRPDEADGTGLGLSIAKWAVEANLGQLSYERVNGRGSTFRITLPASPHLPPARPASRRDATPQSVPVACRADGVHRQRHRWLLPSPTRLVVWWPGRDCNAARRSRRSCSRRRATAVRRGRTRPTQRVATRIPAVKLRPSAGNPKRLLVVVVEQILDAHDELDAGRRPQAAADVDDGIRWVIEQTARRCRTLGRCRVSGPARPRR